MTVNQGLLLNALQNIASLNTVFDITVYQNNALYEKWPEKMIRSEPFSIVSMPVIKDVDVPDFSKIPQILRPLG